MEQHDGTVSSPFATAAAVAVLHLTDSLKPGRLRYVGRVASRVVGDPVDSTDRVLERLAAVAERATGRAGPHSYPKDEDWEALLHRQLGAQWPCPAGAEFDVLWESILADLVSRGLEVGRGAYGGWDDADSGLARAIWCLARHARPERVVETGVARGLTTRVVLEALERNGSGQLYSIDLPPLTVPERRREIGAAVPTSRRDRWHYLEGSSRRRLRPLLRELEGVDLFIHDSWHSTRNVRWELGRAWASLGERGALVADDIDFNRGFATFAACNTGAEVLHCPAD